MGLVGTQAVRAASLSTIGRYCRHLSPKQLGVVGANAAGITMLAELSAEQTRALTAQAFAHVPPSAFETLDQEKLWVLSPPVMAVLTLDQLSKAPLPVIVTITANQAKALGTAVKDRSQDPRLLFTRKVHAQLHPKVKKIIPVSHANEPQAGLVTIALLTGLVALPLLIIIRVFLT